MTRPEQSLPDAGADLAREAALADLTARLGRLAGQQPSADEARDEVADLEVASEELRVVEEEVRVQQEQIEQLLSRYEAERHWRNQFSSLVPVGLFVTDGAGKILDANPALAAMLQVGLHRLRGKPLSVFLDPEDVPAFRSALRALGSGETTEYRATITLKSRLRRESRAELFGFPAGSPHRGEAQWVLVPEFWATEPEVLVGPHPVALAPTDDPMSEDASMRLAVALVQLSALQTGTDDDSRLLGRIAELAREAVPGAAWVSISLGASRGPEGLGSTATEAQEFDGLQFRAQDGPCWTAQAGNVAVLSGDVAADPRWPALAGLAARSPVRSVLALPVRPTGGPGGVLGIYSPERDAFGPSGRRIAEMMAAAVTGVLQNAADRASLSELAVHLERALTSRAVIDQAKGVLMARMGVDADTAFARLVSLSNSLNVKLRDLAHLVIEGHADEVIAASRR